MPTDNELVQVRVNDMERRFPRATTLAVLVGQWTTTSAGCAAAINGAVVPRRAVGESRDRKRRQCRDRRRPAGGLT